MRVDGSQSTKLSSNVVCRFAFALLLVLAAGPVQAQVATAMNFQTSEVVSSGAQVRSSKDFTLYALGYWQRPATPQIEAASAIDAEEVVIREVGAGQRDPCLSPPYPHMCLVWRGPPPSAGCVGGVSSRRPSAGMVCRLGCSTR